MPVEVAAETKKSDGKPRERRNRDAKLGYKLSQEALKIARERLSKGLMHPWVYHILHRVRLFVIAFIRGLLRDC